MRLRQKAPHSTDHRIGATRGLAAAGVCYHGERRATAVATSAGIASHAVVIGITVKSGPREAAGSAPTSGEGRWPQKAFGGAERKGSSPGCTPERERPKDKA